MCQKCYVLDTQNKYHQDTDQSTDMIDSPLLPSYVGKDIGVQHMVSNWINTTLEYKDTVQNSESTLKEKYIRKHSVSQ